MSQPEFDEWSDRIISGVGNLKASTRSLKNALCTMIMHLGPTEDHKPDIHFIKMLRMAAVKEVAHANFLAYQAEIKAEREASSGENLTQ